MTTNRVPESSTQKRTLLLLAAIILIIGVITLRHCAGLNVNYVNPMVTVERDDLDTRALAKVMPSQLIELADNSEVYRTADRLREVSALSLGLALYAASEIASGRRLRDINAVVRGMLTAGLLPPGIEFKAPALLLSPLAKLLLRFRSDPLMIEVIDTPLRREDGPALMIRIPGSGDNAASGSVFIANRLGDIDPPPPFAPLSDCVRAGWIDQPLAETEIPYAEQQQLRAWLSSKQHK